MVFPGEDQKSGGVVCGILNIFLQYLQAIDICSQLRTNGPLCLVTPYFYIRGTFCRICNHMSVEVKIFNDFLALWNCMNMTVHIRQLLQFSTGKSK